MDHKTILTTAGVILITVVAASSAMALNIGILASPATDNVGEMEIRPVAAPSAAPRPLLDGPAELPATTAAIVSPVTSTELRPAPPGAETPPAARPAVVPTKPPSVPVTAVPRPKVVPANPSVARLPGAAASVSSDDRADDDRADDDRADDDRADDD